MSNETENTHKDRPYLCLLAFLFSLLILLATCVTAKIAWRGAPPPAPSVPTMPSVAGQTLTIRLIKGRTGAAAIQRAQRAIVFVDSPYSVNALNAGQHFLRGMVYVSQRSIAINAEVYWIENDAEDWCKEWITSLGEDGLMEVAVPVGNGAILWMEAGKVVRFQLGHEIGGAYEIKELTFKLWNGVG